MRWRFALSLFDRDKSAARTPVSVITGFLGSGKTTLLNNILRHPGMADSAVIVNEFGDVPLDHLLMAPVSGEVAVLASGCICCTIRSDLEQTLRGLLADRDAAKVPSFSRVLIETTGLADPAPIVQMVLNNPLVSHFVRLDTVAATVDAANAATQIAQHPAAVKQIALADRLLLTKTDLADGGALRPHLRALNPAAPVIEVRHGAVEPDALFGAALFDPGRGTPDPRRWICEEAYADDRASHTQGVEAFCMTFDAPLPWETVSGWLAAMRRWRGEHLLRVKGILHLREEDAPVAIHGVHHVFHPPVRLDAWPDADRRSRIVFITRGLSRAEIEASWEEAQALAA